MDFAANAPSAPRPITFFSVRDINSTDDYVRFRNVKLYMDQKLNNYFEGRRKGS